MMHLWRFLHFSKLKVFIVGFRPRYSAQHSNPEGGANVPTSCFQLPLEEQMKKKKRRRREGVVVVVVVELPNSDWFRVNQELKVHTHTHTHKTFFLWKMQVCYSRRYILSRAYYLNRSTVSKLLCRNVFVWISRMILTSSSSFSPVGFCRVVITRYFACLWLTLFYF